MTLNNGTSLALAIFVNFVNRDNTGPAELQVPDQQPEKANTACPVVTASEVLGRKIDAPR